MHELAEQLSNFKSAPSNLTRYKGSCKMKTLKFGTKNSFLGYFWDIILRNYCHISNQHSHIFRHAKFHPKKIKTKTKNRLNWAVLNSNLKKLWSYFTPAPSNMSKCTFL